MAVDLCHDHQGSFIFPFFPPPISPRLETRKCFHSSKHHPLQSYKYSQHGTPYTPRDRIYQRRQHLADALSFHCIVTSGPTTPSQTELREHFTVDEQCSVISVSEMSAEDAVDNLREVREPTAGLCDGQHTPFVTTKTEPWYFFRIISPAVCRQPVPSITNFTPQHPDVAHQSRVILAVPCSSVVVIPSPSSQWLFVAGEVAEARRVDYAIAAGSPYRLEFSPKPESIKKLIEPAISLHHLQPDSRCHMDWLRVKTEIEYCPPWPIVKPVVGDVAEERFQETMNYLNAWYGRWGQCVDRDIRLWKSIREDVEKGSWRILAWTKVEDVMEEGIRRSLLGQCLTGRSAMTESQQRRTGGYS